MSREQAAKILAKALVIAAGSALVALAAPWPLEWWRLAAGFYGATMLLGVGVEFIAKKAKQGRNDA